MSRNSGGDREQDGGVDGRPFIARWSQRKTGQQPRPATAVATGATIPDNEATQSQPPLTDADMPPLESLREGSDVSGFLSPGVSKELRRLALRRVFHLPAFNVCDGLDDYDEDFTSFVALGSVVTAEMRRRIAAARDTATGRDDPDPGDTEVMAAEAQAPIAEPDAPADVERVARNESGEEPCTTGEHDHGEYDHGAGECLPGTSR